MESLQLKLGAPAADRRVVEEPVADLSVEPDDKPDDKGEPALELLPALDIVDEPEEEPDNAFLSDDERLQSSDPLKLYVRQIGDGRLLTVAEERELARRKDLGDVAAKRRLIECNLRLVMSVTRNYTRAGVPLHVAEQVRRALRSRRQLTQKLNRDATIEEIARDSGFTPERVRELFGLVEDPVSLETPVGDGESMVADLIEDEK